MRLLIAEDEKDLADALCVLFEKISFRLILSATDFPPTNMPAAANTTR